MLLVKDDELLDLENRQHPLLNEAIELWGARQPSALLHHGLRCCALAREWVFASDYSHLNGESCFTGPRWLRSRYNWGPSRWPMSWCEAVKLKTLDCGAHSALAREVFAQRGLSVYSLQLIQQYTSDTAAHWCAKWQEECDAADWIYEDLIYHEACAVETSVGTIKVWDPSLACWLDPRVSVGFGSVLALRLTNPAAAELFMWGENRLEANRWQRLRESKPGMAAPGATHRWPTSLLTESLTTTN